MKVSAELDFDQVNKTVESYDPNTKVIRSQQRDERRHQGRARRPRDPIRRKARSPITSSTKPWPRSSAARARASASRSPWRWTGPTSPGDKDGTREYVPRTQEELDKFTALVKNAVGYQPGSKDEVFVTNLRFDNQFLVEEQDEMKKIEKQEWVEIGARNTVSYCFIVLFALWFFRGLVQNLAAAMNPPMPKYAGLNLEPEDEKIPQNVQKQKDILERVEFMTRTEPINIANLIKTWLHEEKIRDNGDKKKKPRRRRAKGHAGSENQGERRERRLRLRKGASPASAGRPRRPS